MNHLEGLIWWQIDICFVRVSTKSSTNLALSDLYKTQGLSYQVPWIIPPGARNNYYPHRFGLLARGIVVAAIPKTTRHYDHLAFNFMFTRCFTGPYLQGPSSTQDYYRQRPIQPKGIIYRAELVLIWRNYRKWKDVIGIFWPKWVLRPWWGSWGTRRLGRPKPRTFQVGLRLINMFQTSWPCQIVAIPNKLMWIINFKLE
jgi:hypothetical protein